MLINHDNFIESIKQKSACFTSRQRTYVRTILKCLPKLADFNLLILLEELVLVKLCDSKKLIHFTFDLISAYAGICPAVLKLEKAYFLRKVKDQDRDEKFANVLDQELILRSKEILIAEQQPRMLALFYALLASGCRGIDMTRMKKITVTGGGSKATGIVPFDKSNANFKCVYFDFDLIPVDWRPSSDLWTATKERICKLDFKNDDLKRLRELVLFRPHELRSVKAILLILKGLSMSEVMKSIGWKTESSLLRYIKTDYDLIQSKSSYEEVVSLVNC